MLVVGARWPLEQTVSGFLMAAPTSRIPHLFVLLLHLRDIFLFAPHTKFQPPQDVAPLHTKAGELLVVISPPPS